MKEYTPEYLEHIRRIIQAEDKDQALKELADLHLQIRLNLPGPPAQLQN